MKINFEGFEWIVYMSTNDQYVLRRKDKMLGYVYKSVYKRLVKNVEG
jgi:hypothetical protein